MAAGAWPLLSCAFKFLLSFPLFLRYNGLYTPGNGNMEVKHTEIRNSDAKDTEELKNAKRMPRVFYAKHMEAGIAKYSDGTILVDPSAMKRMAKTFAGKPVFVDHQKVDVENLQQQADGYVADCFYNSNDGSLWSKIIVVSDGGHKAIDSGYSVSNAYVPKNISGKGKHLNVDFDKKIIDAEFTHLALCPKDHARYETSTIMTPEQFNSYQDTKSREIAELRNTKLETNKEKKLMFFRKKEEREEITNSEDIKDTDFVLIDGKEVTVGEMKNSIKQVETLKAKKKEEVTNTGTVEVDGKPYTIEQLKASHTELQNMKKKASEDEFKNETEEEKNKRLGSIPPEKLKTEKLNGLSDEEILAAAAAIEVKNSTNFKKLQEAPNKPQKAVVSISGVALGQKNYG